MTELVKIEAIPTGHRKGDRYPWAEWETLLQTGEPGQAIKITRDDVPQNSSAYRNWSNGQTRRNAIIVSAKGRGMMVAVRGDDMYLYYHKDKE